MVEGLRVVRGEAGGLVVGVERLVVPVAGCVDEPEPVPGDGARGVEPRGLLEGFLRFHERPLIKQPIAAPHERRGIAP